MSIAGFVSVPALPSPIMQRSPQRIFLHANHRAPFMPPTSSSAVNQKSIVLGIRSWSFKTRAAIRAAAQAPFMSLEPRPQIIPSGLMSPLYGG